MSEKPIEPLRTFGSTPNPEHGFVRTGVGYLISIGPVTRVMPKLVHPGRRKSSLLDLVINLRTAKALGLTIPQSLLGRADEVIQ